jgi:pimeloyl-ACP methyl ester carboxylesterase
VVETVMVGTVARAVGEWRVIACALLTAGMVAVAPLMAVAGETTMTLDGGISATLYIPDQSGPVPAVLMLHGFASSKDEVGNMYAREAKALAEKGIASLRIDFAGFGKSTGDAGSTTVDGQLGNAKMALDVLRKTDGIDPARIGVLGFSLGGGIATLLAGNDGSNVESLVTWSSVGDFQNDFVNELGQKAFDRAKEDGIVGLDLGWRTIALKQSFFDSLAKYKIDDAIASYAGAYLTIAGSKDFSAGYTDRFVGLSKSQTKEAFIVQDADHIFGVLEKDQTFADSVIKKTAEWFATTLSATPTAQ